MQVAKSLVETTGQSFDESKFQALEKAKKTSQQAVANVMGVSQSTVWRWEKKTRTQAYKCNQVTVNRH